ncbi:MAG: DUF502 domain-containing protein [Alphaproteobacteria bacterium]|nr:MAG: DUF502 domain-containing protein [Alphaproteobacteria bacterium]
MTDSTDNTELQPPRLSLLHRLRNYFLTGIVVAAPLAITVYLAWAFVRAVDNKITPLIPDKYNPETYLAFSVPGLGLVVVVVFLTLLGALAANLFGRTLIRLGERLLDRMPIIRSIYGTLKQIFETVVSQKSNSFKEVVLVEYPRRGLWALAFVTSETRGEIDDKTEGAMVNVFLPTTPNPTSGFLLFVPRKDVIELDMTVDDGIKYVISAGLVTPARRPPKAIAPPPEMIPDSPGQTQPD